MSTNLKKRFSTSIALILILFLMSINNYFLCYFLILIAVLSILEFIKMIKIIFKKNIYKVFSSIIFMSYIFFFFSAFFLFSSYIFLKIIIFIILITCISSDIGVFIFRKFFKGPKLTKISTNKTFSGAVGSLIFSSITTSLLIYYITGSSSLIYLIIGSSISIACQIGDLFFSFLKRKSSLKDTGNFLPGHGGILDRIDGILLGIPTGFFSLIIIY